jgi:hypothetical protein
VAGEKDRSEDVFAQNEAACFPGKISQRRCAARGKERKTVHIIKSVGVLSVAKIMGLVYSCMGLIFAPFFLLIGLVGSMAGQVKSPFAGMFGIVFAIFMPVLYGVIGFVAGLLGALLYNLFARLVGGFALELEMRTPGLSAPYPIVPPNSASI